MTEQGLIDLFFARSGDAVSALQAQYGAYCRAIASHLLSDVRDVDECLNDCWLAVWQAIPPAQPKHFKGWLAAIVRNRALTIGRGNGRRPKTLTECAQELTLCLSEMPDPQSEAEAKEIADAIRQFLCTQKEDIRIAFLRRYWYIDSVEDTAAYLGWSVSKTKTVLFRTRNKLRDFLEKECLL